MAALTSSQVRPSLSAMPFEVRVLELRLALEQRVVRVPEALVALLLYA